MKKSDLMGLGVPPLRAERLGNEAYTVTAQGATRASATVLGRSQYLNTVTATNSGAGVVLPGLGGDNGCLIGDDFIINNQVAGGITLYAPTGTTISMLGSAQSGSGGVALSSHTTATLYPVTVTTWIGCVGT